MPRLLSSYAANKRVEDGLKRKQEQIRIDYIKATHRHLDETEKLVDDLIHINVRTPSAFELRPHTVSGCGSIQSLATSSNSVQLHPHNQQASIVSHHHQDVAKDAGADRRLSSAGISPLNFRTQMGTSKSPGHPIIQIRGDEVFYQYQKLRRNWKKVEPPYKTKLLLHRNNTVIKALSHFNARQDELSDTPALEDSSNTMATSSKRKSSAFSESAKRDSVFSRRRSRRESRLSYIGEDKESVSQVVEIPPQLSPGHTPRMLDGWTIMKWCLWNKKQTTPVWATKRYAEMKTREYKQFIASKKRTEEQDAVSSKPNSANAAQRKDPGRKESILEDNKLVPRAKSVPIGKFKMAIDETTEHLPSIDRGIIRPTTSILRTGDHTTHSPEEGEARPKTTSRRRVALDTFIDEDLFHKQNSYMGEDSSNFSVELKNSKHFGRNDGKSVSIYAWDTLDETEKETSDEDN